MQLPPVNMALRCALGLQAGHEACLTYLSCWQCPMCCLGNDVAGSDIRYGDACLLQGCGGC